MHELNTTRNKTIESGFKGFGNIQKNILLLLLPFINIYICKVLIVYNKSGEKRGSA